MDRRQLLRAMAASGIALAGGAVLGACDVPIPADFGLAPDPGYGPLGPPDANGLRVPAGFRSRVVATSGQLVPGTAHLWHGDPDGGACFATGDGGWIYVSNAESALVGGASMVRFAADGRIVEARRILFGTTANCAGGATPWGTWLSCEEHALGQVWECDPTGRRAAAVRPAMGQLKHEAAAADPVHRVIYLTEDEGDGCLYRFRPTTWGDLSAGVLEVLTEGGGGLGWARVPEPTPGLGTPTRRQVASAKHFAGGEGACVDHRGALFFTTKGDGRVWALDPPADRLVVVYDDSSSPTPELTGVDNITLDRRGVLFVAEDGGSMQIVAVGRGQRAVPVVEVTGVQGSEITGPAFSPDGRRLYFSSQRNPGRTYEVTGPW